MPLFSDKSTTVDGAASSVGMVGWGEHATLSSHYFIGDSDCWQQHFDVNLRSHQNAGISLSARPKCQSQFEATRAASKKKNNNIFIPTEIRFRWLSLFGVTSWHVYVALSGLKIDTPLCSAAAGDVGVVPLTDTGDQ